MPRHGIAAVDAVSGIPTGWKPDIRAGSATGDMLVAALAVKGQVIYVGGGFRQVGPARRSALAAIDLSSGRATSWSPDLAGGQELTVNAVQPNGRTLYIGGEFKAVNGIARHGLAAIDLKTAQLSGWDPKPNGPVDALMVNRYGVVAAGRFSGVEMSDRRSLAEIDLRTGAVTTWNPRPTGDGPIIGALLAEDDVLYVGGTFTGIAGKARHGLAAFSLANLDLRGWAPRVDGGVYGVEVMAIQDSVLYLGGDFESIDGANRSAAGAVDTSTAELMSWNPHIGLNSSGGTSEVTGIATAGSRIYLAGRLDNVSGQARTGLVAVATSGALLPWAPKTGIRFGGSTYPSEARTVAVAGARIFVGGHFSSINGQPRFGVALVAPDGSLTAGWNPRVQKGAVYNSVEAIVPTPSAVFIAGDFRAVNGLARPGVAALNLDSTNLRGWVPPVVDWAAYDPNQLLLVGGTLYVNGYVTGNGEQLVALNVNSALR
jgi:hypothetical protein